MMKQMRLVNKRNRGARPGFTLIELLVVITIILIVSAVALPTILPALSHRQVSEAARILQAALSGARDSAIRNNAPSGIRLLPDPAFPIQYTGPNNTGVVSGTAPLASNRIIPLGAAPDYTEGLVSIYATGAYAPANFNLITNYSAIQAVNGFGPNLTNPLPCLVLEESVVGTNGLPNAPTSWFWNIRVGDKVQISNAGPWYTVVGPMTIPPQGATIGGTFYANNELFVNVGPPGTLSPWTRSINNGPALPTEYLLLVNGVDDNNNGWIDEGFDGVDNNLSLEVKNNLQQLIDEFIPGTQNEWETETWHGAIVSTLESSSLHSMVSLPYTIQRRPAPVINAREVLLPTNVVIDMTTGAYPTLANPSMERSRLPVNEFTGYVDIVVYPNGTVVPTTIYSSPALFGVSSAFFHFWLAERSDVAAPQPNAVINGSPPYLPVPQGLNQSSTTLTQAASLFPGGGVIKGEYRLVTLFTRTGQITTNDDVPFDGNNLGTANYNPSLPFLQAQQGVRSGQ
jgi:prepilin-type N-terminal cleavage/methylation domain-containing protein